MPDYLPIPRFPLPNDWSPEGTRCIAVTIPDDDQYQAIITGLIDHLKWSKNYARDATKTGAATVSRTWQAALELTPIVQGCGAMLRQNPTNPCIIEQSQDGGETWIEAWNNCDCDCEPTPELPTEDADCIAVSSLITLYCEICRQVNIEVTAGTPPITIGAQINTYLSGLLGVPTHIAGFASQLSVDLFNQDLGRDQFDEYNTYADYYDEFIALVDPDGTLPSGWYGDFVTWLATQESMPFISLTDILKGIIGEPANANWNLIRTLQSECISMQSGATWTVTFDFAADWESGDPLMGWEARNDNTTADGLVWQDEVFADTLLRRGIDCWRTSPFKAHILQTRVYWNVDNYLNPDGDAWTLFDTSAQTAWLASPEGEGSDLILIEAGAGEYATRLNINYWCSISAVPPADVGGHVYFRKIQVIGRGFNPYRNEGY